MQTAKLFQNGQSQAVRLPKQFRFQGKQVFIKKVDNTVVLIPADDPWKSLFDSLDQFTDDFLSNRGQPMQQQKRENF